MAHFGVPKNWERWKPVLGLGGIANPPKNEVSHVGYLPRIWSPFMSNGIGVRRHPKSLGALDPVPLGWGTSVIIPNLVALGQMVWP